MRYFFLFTLLIPALALHAQDTSGRQTLTRYFTERDIETDLDWRRIDTSSSRLERYNPLRSASIVYNDLGNLGLPARSLVFNTNRPIGFVYGFIPHQVYFLNPTQTQYINTRSPYTDITYTQGSNDLLYLRLKHAQNILPRWNAGIELNRITSLGFLLRQYSSLYGVNVFSSVSSKNKHYLLLANLTWNFGNNEESGGILYDSSFEKLTGLQKKVYTRLSSTQTLFHNRQVYLKQFFRFGEAKHIYTAKDTVYNYEVRSQIVHTFHLQETSYGIRNSGESDAVLLPHQYYDTVPSTYDSFYVAKLSNKLEYQILDSAKNSFLARLSGNVIKPFVAVGFSHELVRVSQPTFVRNYQNYILHGLFEQVNIADHGAEFRIETQYVIGGYNINDSKTSILAGIKLGPVKLKAFAMIQQFEPDFNMQLFRSNAFIWTNSFQKVGARSAGVSLKTTTWRHPLFIQGYRQNISNWVYTETDGTPQVITSPVNITSLTVQKTFQLYRFFFEHDLLFQESGSDKIRLPKFSGAIRYYYQARLFGISRFQLGFNLYYNSAYRGDAYNPYTTRFFLQNSVTLGNYPVLSPFFVADIKRASLFAVYEHVNMDWSKKGMYYTAHYPIDLMSLRMGVRWRFYD